MTKSTYKSNSRSSRFRGARFGLRLVFLTITIICVSLGWYIHRVNVQKRAVTWIKQNGGSIQYDFEIDGVGEIIPNPHQPVADWLCKYFGIDFFARVSRVEFLDDTIDDVAPMSGLTSIEYLSLGGNDISDITPLVKMKRLKHLFLAETKTKDLTPLRNLVHLEYLHLFRTEIADLTPLKNLNELKFLHISKTNVNDLGPLAGLRKLEELHLAFTRVHDLSPIVGMDSLVQLNFCSTPVTDLQPIRSLTSLKHLNIAGTKVNDLMPLSNLTNLYAVVWNSKELDKEVKKFERVLPGCVFVNYDEEPDEYNDEEPDG